MPQMGFDMTQGTLVRWLKREGDSVARGEAIAEIETDKAVVEIEAFASGVLRRVLAQEGQVIPVGQVIGIIAEPQEELPELEGVVAAPPTRERLAQVREERAAAPPPLREERVRVSPLARRIAEEHGVDLRLVTGTGPGGRVVRKDVLDFVAQKEAAPKEEVAPELSPMRQAIARRMSQSKREIPHFYLTTDVDMTAALRLREELNQTAGEEGRISVNDLVVRAVALALVKFPQLNASYINDRLQRNPTVNVGIAIALEEGLVAPAIVDCASKTLAEIAKASKDLAERARGGVLRAEEYTGATFTVTNLGMYDVDSFVAIINPPQSAILSMGTVRSQPVVREGKVAIAQVAKVTLSADHRVTDGAQAAQFLGEVKGLLQQPWRLLL